MRGLILMLVALGLAAGDIETDGDDVHVLPARREAVFEGEGVETHRGGLDDLGEMQESGDRANLAVCCRAY